MCFCFLQIMVWFKLQWKLIENWESEVIVKKKMRLTIRLFSYVCITVMLHCWCKLRQTLNHCFCFATFLFPPNCNKKSSDEFLLCLQLPQIWTKTTKVCVCHTKGVFICTSLSYLYIMLYPSIKDQIWKFLTSFETFQK